MPLYLKHVCPVCRGCGVENPAYEEYNYDGDGYTSSCKRCYGTGNVWEKSKTTGRGRKSKDNIKDDNNA